MATAENSADGVELFGRKPVISVKPVTADMCMLTWAADEGSITSGKILTGATNVTISYQQQVIRRRTLASSSNRPIAVIYPTQPVGNMQIQRLFASMVSTSGVEVGKDSGTHAIFSFPGWDVCKGTATIFVGFNGASAYAACNRTNPGYTIRGATVTGYNISLEAENLTVVDSITVEFLQLCQMAAADGDFGSGSGADV